MGEWYWNGGEKKSQASFEQLIKIVGHPEFRPEDVAVNNWRLIDAQLSGERSEGSNNEVDWEDEQVSRSEGWIKTPIKIKVPFHKKMKHPGQKEFNTGILHHRKLISVIRERITRPSMYPHLILNLTNYIGNPMLLLSRCEFMANYTCPKLSLRLTTVSKIKLLNWDATFQELSSVSCSPPMARNSHLSVPPNCGLFIL